MRRLFVVRKNYKKTKGLVRSFFPIGKCGNFFYNLVRNPKFVFNHSVCMAACNFERNKYSKETILFLLEI